MNASGWLRVFVSGAIAVGFSVTAVAASPAAVTVSYQAPASLTLHEPVLVDFTIENASAEPVQIDLGDNRRALFVVKVEGPRGVLPDAVVHDTGLIRRGLVTVKANERYTQQLLLNDWSSFQDPGQYDIRIQLRSRVVSVSGTAIDTPTSGRLQLVIAPRNEGALRATCDRLAQTVASAWAAQDRIDAANALSRVDDPVVVPYIQELLAKPRSQDAILMGGLVRVGTPEARVALDEASRSTDNEQAALARDALRRMPAR